MAATRKNNYQSLANEISSYVQAHLADEILIDDLAQCAGVSKYHLNRVFDAVTGFTLGEFITRRRLQAAHATLASGRASVIDVSLAVGYASHSAFSRAFLGAFGCSPSEVRIGATPLWRTPNTIKKLQENDVILQPEILHLTTQKYRGLYGAGWHNNSFEQLGHTLFTQLASTLAQAGLAADFNLPIGVSLDSPWQNAQDKSRFFIGVVSDSLSAELPLQDYLWQQGKWARFYHEGSYALMWQTISRVYANWVIPAEITLRDDAIVQVYLNNPANTPPAHLRTALYFPIEIEADDIAP